MQSMQCAACGFHADTVTPSDAAVALRSYPRRFRAVLVRPDDEEGADVVRRPASDGWSALDHAAHAARSIEAATEALRKISFLDADPLVAYEPERQVDAGPNDDVLAAVQTACEAAAAQVDRLRGADWDRRGRLGEGEPVIALDVARHAVHEGVHHLRAAEEAVRQAVSAR